LRSEKNFIIQEDENKRKYTARWEALRVSKGTGNLTFELFKGAEPNRPVRTPGHYWNVFQKGKRKLGNVVSAPLDWSGGGGME